MMHKKMRENDMVTGFLQALNRSYKNYNTPGGAKSTNKLKPIHQWLADTSISLLGDEYTARSIRADDKTAQEASFSGKYYPKKVDVGIYYCQHPITAISFKFVTSNFKQNANNYFEHLMGETANMQRGNINYGALFVLPSAIPYLERGGERRDIETLSSHHIDKYRKLLADKKNPHRPEALGFIIVDIDHEAKYIRGLAKIDKLGFSKDVVKFLKTEATLEKFFSVFVKLTKHRAKQLT